MIGGSISVAASWWGKALYLEPPIAGASKGLPKSYAAAMCGGGNAHPILCCASRCMGGGVKADVCLRCLTAQSQELSCVVSSTRGLEWGFPEMVT